MSSPDLRKWFPTIATALALSGCVAEPVPSRVAVVTPIVVEVETNPAYRNLLVQFSGTLLSAPNTPGGNTVTEPAILNCTLSERVNNRGTIDREFHACGIRAHVPPLVPLTREEYCKQYNFGLVAMGQLSLKFENTAVTIFSTPSDLRVLDPYSRCPEFTDSNAQAPALRRSIYERPARGHIYVAKQR